MRRTLLAAMCVSFATPAAAQLATIEPDTIEIGGRAIAVERGAFQVPSIRGRTDLPPLTLRFLRIPGTAETPGPPIVYLSGGPGASGIDEILTFPAAWIDTLRAVGDIVALDQRGTGASEPLARDCPGTAALPLDRPADPARFLEAYRTLLNECVLALRGEGVEPAMFTTAESAEDVEALRVALGASRIALLGGSYGSHLALAVVRRFPSSIDAIVMASVEGPDHTFKLPSAIDEGLDGLFRHMRATDAALARTLTDPGGTLRALIARLEASPVRVRVGDDEVVVGAWDLRRMAAEAAGRYPQGRRFPAELSAMVNGDFTPLGAWATAWRRGAGLSLMGTAMDCASYASTQRLARIRGEESRSLVGGVVDFPFPALCDPALLPRLPDAFRTPVRSPVRALFIAGTLDARTPVANAHEVARGMPNATVLIVENGPHGTPPLPELPGIIASFLRGRSVPGRPLLFPAWRFERN